MTPAERLQAENAVRTTLTLLLLVVVLAAGSELIYRRLVRIGEQPGLDSLGREIRQLTEWVAQFGFAVGTSEDRRTARAQDQYHHAVKNLGSPSMTVRLGAIHVLQWIAFGQDSERSEDYRQAIQSVLAAFLREHAGDNGPRLAEDLQTAATVLTGQITPRSAGFDLNRVRLPYAKLTFAQLRNADLTDAHLEHATLDDADLRFGKLVDAHLDSASFRQADLRWAVFTGADVGAASFHGACLDGADLRGTDLSRAQGLTRSLRAANTDDSTVLPPKLRPPPTES